MKKILLPIFASVWAAVAIGQTINYTFTVPAGGCRPIADNFYFGNNTLEQLFPGVNGMLTVYKWNAASQAYVTYNYDPNLGGWDPPGGTLKPGEGAFIENPNTFPLTFTFTGADLAPPARTRPPAGFYLVGCPRPQACGFPELMGFSPVPGDQVLFYDQGCSSNSSTATFTAAGGWSPSAPLLAIGKAAFVSLVAITTPPVITQQPQSVIATNCGSTVTFTVVATGTPPLAYQWFKNGAAIAGATLSTLTLANVQVANAGSYNVRVSNSSGSVTSSAATLTVDTVPPVVVCPGNLVRECTNPSGTPVTYTATATDNCPGVTVTCTPPSGSLFPLGIRNVTCTATDGATNRSSCTFTVTIRDTTPPVITCPTNIVRECTGPSGTPVTYTVTASDICDSNLTVVCVPPSGTLFGLGTGTVTCTATDDATNRASCTFSVTIRDTTPPGITCPSNVFVQCLSGVPVPPATLAQFLAQGGQAGDNCDTNLAYTSSDAPLQGGSCGGIIRRTHTVTDDATNSASCVQIITVRDTIPPVLVGVPPNQSYQCLREVPPPANVTATDNCVGTITPMLVSTTNGSCPTTITRTWTATDACTNRASATQTISVNDTIPPVITCPLIFAAQCLSSVPARPITLAQFLAQGGQASDNCDTSLTYTSFDGPLTGGACGGTIRRTHTVTDDCTNSASCVQIITVRDTTPPTIFCSSNLVADCTDNPIRFTVAASDNCDTNVTASCQPPSGSMFPVGTTTVSCTATDGCTNRSTCTFTVTVRNCVEIDHFASSGAAVGLRMPNGSLVNVVLTGPSTVSVALDSLQDTPANGLEEVNTELVAMNLTDIGGLGYQLIAGSLNGLPPSLGEIEETQNRQAGRLDLHGPDAPFCLPGALNCDGTTARSTFEVLFAVILPNGTRLHNRTPLHMEATITEKPPRTLYRHVIPAPIELFDDNNNPTGVFLVTAEHDTRPREIDHFPQTTAIIELCTSNSTEKVIVQGPTTVAVDIGLHGETTLTDGAGHDRVLTHMLAMNLSGPSSLGPVTVELNPDVESGGDIIERINATPGILDIQPFRPAGLADSCFNMFVRLTVQTPNGPIVLQNRDPKRMCSVIDYKPPGPGTVYESPERVPLYGTNGQPSGFFLCATRHIPVSACANLQIALVPVPEAPGIQEVQVCWRDNGSACALQFTRDLNTPISWQNWTGPIITRPDGYQCVVIRRPSQRMFFRLCGGCAMGAP